MNGQSTLRWWHPVALGALGLVSGCAGSARLWLAPVDPARLNPRRPLVAQFDVPQAYFWINEQDEVCVALSRGTVSGDRTLAVSLVLEGVPAGYGRKYRINRRTLRGIIRDRGPARRYASYRGIVSVWLDEDEPDVLSGRFRIWANEQEYRAWMDFWAGNNEVLLLGKFRAVRDRDEGGVILERTEVEELKRGPPLSLPRPVTGPPLTTQPAD